MFKRTSAQNFNDLDRWIKPAEWLDLPYVDKTKSKIVGTVAIFDQPYNLISFKIQASGTSGAGYLVDWGDGAGPQTYASNTIAQKNYSWSDFDDSTLTASGFRQALVTITPLDEDGSFSLVDMTPAFVGLMSSGTHAVYSQAWTQLRLSSPNSTQTIGNSTITKFGYLERLEILSHASTTMYGKFQGLYNLQSVYVSMANAILDARFMFQDCYSLYDVTLDITVGNGCDGGNTFGNCRSLRKNPSWKWNSSSRFWTLAAHFQNCSNLTEITSLYNTSQTTNFASCFSGCSSLERPPQWRYDSGTSFVQMFANCSSLKDFPVEIFDQCPASVATDAFASMFSGCSSLQRVPRLDLKDSYLSCSTLFNSCTSLEYVGPITLNHNNTATAKSWYRMFYNCLSLQTIESITFTNAHLGVGIFPANVNGMFFNCGSLRNIPEMDFGNMSATSNFTNTFSGCNTANIFDATNTKVTFSIANMMLNGDALNAIYTGLQTVTGQTITVAGNPGTAGDDPTIATAKGWTVTG